MLTTSNVYTYMQQIIDRGYDIFFNNVTNYDDVHHVPTVHPKMPIFSMSGMLTELAIYRLGLLFENRPAVYFCNYKEI